MLAADEKRDLFFDALTIINEKEGSGTILKLALNKIIKNGDINKDSAFLLLLFLNDDYIDVNSKLYNANYDSEKMIAILRDKNYIDEFGISNYGVNVFFLTRYLIEMYPNIEKEFIQIESLSNNEIVEKVKEKLKNA